ncbi:MAG: PEGA domain-containing protein, partial [Chitinivibrionales bacterium]
YNSLNKDLVTGIKGTALFPKVIHSDTTSVDSFPAEGIIIKAKEHSASHILWGEVDSSEYGVAVELGILKMEDGSVSRINVFLKDGEGRKEVVEILESKLIHWYQRSSMVQLIITTSPPGADIYLDTENIGESPYESMIQPGTYELKLEKQGYVLQKIPVSFINGNTYQYDFTISKLNSRDDNRKTFIKFMSISAVCAGLGAVAYIQRNRAYKEYQEAEPPADFDGLYTKAAAWNAAGSVMFVGSGISISVLVLKLVF